MSENNYGALMLKSALSASDDIDIILSPGIYYVPPGNTSAPDQSGGLLIVFSGSPVRRTFIGINSDTITQLVTLVSMQSALAAKQPLDPTLSTLAALTGIADTFPYFTGGDTAALTNISTVGRTVIAASKVEDIVNYLGITALLLAKAPLASPALTGTPTAPTAAQTVNNTQIATTAFVKAAVAALVNSSPAALDTLKELADALGNDANFAATMTNALAGKQPIDPTLTTLAALVGTANTLPYFTGGDTAALTTITDVGRTVIAAAKTADITNYLGIPTMISAALTTFMPKRNFAANDFVRIPDVPGGLILQWGTVVKATPEGAQNVIFPTPFPNFALTAMATPINSVANPGIDVFSQVGGMSNSDVNFVFAWISTQTPADGFRWFALGF